MARILLVDDADFARLRCKKILDSEGYDVLEAATGVEAVASYQENHPDVVLMDITMPDMDGLTALKEIRKLDASATVIMCSALGQKSIVLEAIKSGAKDFVVKPYEPDRVLQTIRSALA